MSWFCYWLVLGTYTVFNMDNPHIEEVLNIYGDTSNKYVLE